MRRRARRAMIGAAALVALVVVVLVVAHWTTVRDHVEAWRFQLTRETETITPDISTQPVILTSKESAGYVRGVTLAASRSDLKAALKEEGYRVIAQRFPRRAYVVIRPSRLTQDEEY